MVTGGPRARLVTLLAFVAAGCSALALADAPAPAPPPPPHFVRPGMVRYHMQRRFDDLRAIEQLLVSGQLDEARTRAFLLVQPETDPGMAPWAADAKGVVEAARALHTAPNVDEACRREARLAEACATCHLHANRPQTFGSLPPPPPDRPTVAARMARHQWAVDRLWEGLVGPTDERWLAGLEMLAAAPPPDSELTGAPALGTRLQELARTALGTRRTEPLRNRADRYGEMLVTCAACHKRLWAPTSTVR